MDLIPNSVSGSEVFSCHDCGQELSQHTNRTYCELRSFDGAKPKGERSTLVGQVCLNCVEKRTRVELRTASSENRAFCGWVAENKKTVHGIRLICDGQGQAFLRVVHEGDRHTLSSGDTWTSIRAMDDSGRIWYGRVVALGYGSQFVSLKPCKS